ncbi:SEC-C metal-binding domain-containing protein [Pendulispora albinea]|uniref:SEC-C domain-containing protein n=1 Tax=Pendulispora albinea TaxID=2741071 RepID=A0ABZ2LMV2_9BACT
MSDQELPAADQLDDDLEPLAKEVADAVISSEEHFGQLEPGADSDEDDAPPRDLAVVRRDAALARRLGDAVHDRIDQLAAIEETFEVDAYTWLADIPFELADHGQLDEAIDLCTALARSLASPSLVCDRAMLLVQAEREDEARQQIEDLRASFPDDLEVLDSVADVLMELGDDDEAEILSRRVREDATEDEIELRLSSTERLVELLRTRGEEDEANELESELDDLDRRVGEYLDAHAAGLPPRLDAPSEPVRRNGAKVGRNDACPCGSGKKFKKCCGQ